MRLTKKINASNNTIQNVILIYEAVIANNKRRFTIGQTKVKR